MKRIMILVLCLGVCLAICPTVSWAVTVQGNNSHWTHIGSVKSGSVIRVVASGTVDFGCMFGGCVDGAGAGVTGSSLVFVKLLDGFKQQIEATLTLNPVESIQKQINAVKSTFGSTHQPNFDQGGVWIKVLKKNGQPYIATQLYYFWEHGDGINKHGLPINEDVDVYAKAHDGGKNPESTSGYGDNKGAYQVSIQYVSQPTPTHTIQPVGQSQSVPATGAGTNMNFKLCTSCAGPCAAGHTCIYVNGICWASCQ
jgi:hypothetical protein